MPPIGPFERTLALRYLRGASGRDERRGFLRFVVLAAIGGVAVGTGALLLALMIVRGFSQEIEAKIVGFGQHVQVETYLGDPIANVDSVSQAVAALDGVVHVAPAVVDFALLSARGEDESTVEGVVLWGTAPDDLPFVADRTTVGTFDLSTSDGQPGVVVGKALAERLGLDVGQRIQAYSTRGLADGSINSRPRLRQFRVAGVFETGLGDFDDQSAFVSLDTARELFSYPPGSVSRLDLTLTDRALARQVSDAVTDEIGPPLFARPIEDVYRGLFAWVELQQSIVPLVISILVLVAAFNIVGALLMVVLEKAREIGTVLAMGASRASVRRLFMVLGLMVGIIGAALGTSAALVFAWIQTEFAIIRLPQDAYYLDRAPVDVALLDVVVTVVATIVICTLAAYLPARAAARVEPVRTIRFGG
ncbi:ABC transporter permease [Rubrivirga sp. IMCC45206]|uniref:ABC transporter permease n=1 Tax=Rubrivirga sp. IMCC45206 TaxID=3391614 RepID=UPI00398FE143